VTVRDLRVVAHQRDVGRLHQLESARHRHTFDGRNDRYVERGDRDTCLAERVEKGA
jgi:hypothetical protein